MSTEETILYSEGLLDKVPESISCDVVGRFNTVTPSPQPTNCCFDEEKDIKFSCCEVTKQEGINVDLHCLGRVLTLNVNIKAVCPNKMIVVGVLLYDSNNKLKAIKIKEIFTGRKNDCRCSDIFVGEFCFLIKDNDLCQCRNFKVKVIANYMNL